MPASHRPRLSALGAAAWVALALTACDTANEHTEAPEHAEAHQETEALALSLNEGARWQMDEHTRTVMVETRVTLDGAAVGSLDDARALGTTLQGQLDRLIQGCTMDGAAHDELHTFLMVYMPAVASLQTVDSVEAASAQHLALKAMVSDYERHFE